MSGPEIVIAGYAETPIAHRSNRSAYDLAGEALSQLLERTGLAKDAIDGFCATAAISEASNPFHGAYLAEVLGLPLNWFLMTSIGGASFLSGVGAAAGAVREGSCEVAVVLGADAPSTTNTSHYGAYRPEFQDPTGLVRPPGAFGLLMRAYENRYGLDYRALGKIAVTQREAALRNENAVAKLKQPIDLGEYLASRMVADPLRLLDSVMFCDGANAVLVTTEQRARSLGLSRTARIAAYAERTNHLGNEPMPDLLETGFAVAGPAAFSRAGLRPSDVSMLQAYDDFTIAVLLQLEQLGFCGAGEGCKFVLETDFSREGQLPLNTGGGQLSAGQPGLASGGLTLVEAVRQLVGEAGPRQVDRPYNAVVTGIGALPHARNWLMSNVMVLEG